MGRLFVKGGGKPAEIITKLNEMAGFSSNEDIELFEVIIYIISSQLHQLDDLHVKVLIHCPLAAVVVRVSAKRWMDKEH